MRDDKPWKYDMDGGKEPALAEWSSCFSKTGLSALGRAVHGPAKLACSFSRSRLDQSKRANLLTLPALRTPGRALCPCEHRLAKNTNGLACAGREHKD